MFEFGPGNPILLWKPVIEPDFGQERFLTDDPTKLFASGEFMHVPVLTGITKYEFLYPAIGKCHRIKQILISCVSQSIKILIVYFQMSFKMKLFERNWIKIS